MNIIPAYQTEILALVKRLHKKQIQWRRYLHQHPELSFEEYETSAWLKKTLRELGYKVLPLKLKSGVLAELTGRKPGPTVAIRSDIDALPVQESTGLPFASKNEGRMHACGHDMHMAAVLGAAAVLAGMREHLKGTVRLIFQPAEEQPPGGARPMIAAGALKNVDIIIGLHVDPDVPVGNITLRDGPAMASVYDFDLVIHGKGGHAARSHQAVDAIVTAAEVVESIQKIVAREIDPVSPATITFGKIEGGNARNTIADRVTLTATARTLDTRVFKKMPSLLKRTVAGVCKARGAKFEFIEVAGYPVLANDPGVNRLLRRNYETLYDRRRIGVTEVVLGGEDFACYLERIPGAMFRLGIRNKKIGADKSWHAPDFMADENALSYGTALLVSTTLDYMQTRGK